MPSGLQKRLLQNVIKAKNLDFKQMAEICAVEKRTLFDWRREKYKMSYEALKKLHKVIGFDMPASIEVLPEYWSTKKAGRIGAICRNELYGNPGTLEGRSKGGRATQKKFTSNPESAKKLGFIIRKEITFPSKSEDLAEFFGLTLGDGSISKYQVTISMNSKTDAVYGNFVKKLIAKLFRTNPAVRIAEKNTLQVVATGRNLIEFLLKHGLKVGDKVAQQVNVPEWIMKNKKFTIRCLRGLIDTDGGIYFHTHVTKGIKYKHIGLCFTSHSTPLLNSVHKILLSLGIEAKNNKKNHVFIYARNEIRKYMDIVGSNNLKHIKRFKSYKTSRI